MVCVFQLGIALACKTFRRFILFDHKYRRGGHDLGHCQQQAICYATGMDLQNIEF